jgi:hypothetical protein
MADIAMCLDKDCPSFKECYRAQAKPNIHWQTYHVFLRHNEKECKDFIPLKNKYVIKGEI